MGWYALFVEAGKEDMVQKCLGQQYHQSEVYTFVPKRLIPEKKAGSCHHVLKILFPSYVFIHTHMTPAMYYELKKLPKYYRLVRSPSFMLDRKYNRTTEYQYITDQNENQICDYDMYFNEIDEEEIRPILQLVNEDNIVDFSSLYVENSQVRVQSGPLLGLEGRIKKIDKRKGRAKVSINLLGEERFIDVGIKVLELM